MGSSWLLLAVLAGISSNISNFFSRYLLKGDEDTLFYSWFFEASRFVVFICVIFFNFSFHITPFTVSFLLALGLVECVANYLYMQMHANTHLSISAIASRTRFIWVPIIAFLLLGERLRFSIYIGIAVLFVGIAIVRSPHKFFADKGLGYAYSSAFLIAISIIMLDYGERFASPIVVLLFLTFPTTVIIPSISKNSVNRLKKFFKRKLWHKLIAAFFNIAALYLFTIALKTGPVSMVSAIYNGALILAVLAGIIFLNERQDIWRKLIGTAVATIGILFLTL